MGLPPNEIVAQLRTENDRIEPAQLGRYVRRQSKLDHGVQPGDRDKHGKQPAAPVNVVVLRAPDRSELMTGIPFPNDAAAPGYTPSGQTQSVYANSDISIAAAASFVTPILAVSTYNSYNFTTTAYTNSQTSTLAALTVQVLVTFYADPLGAQPLYSERWYGWSGNSSADAAPLKGRGPVAGPYMSFQIFNNSAISNMTLLATNLWGNNVVVPESDWRQDSVGGMNSGLGTIEGLPAAYGDDCILASVESLTIGTGMTEWQPLPLAKGPIYYRMRFSAVPATGVAIAVGAGLQYGSLASGPNGINVVAFTGTAATTEYTGVVTGGRSPLYIVIQTTSTTAVTVSYTFMAISPGS